MNPALIHGATEDKIIVVAMSVVLTLIYVMVRGKARYSTNYEGARVAYRGFYVFLALVCTSGLVWDGHWRSDTSPKALLWVTSLIVGGIFAVVGWWDDAYGNRSASGFKGHLRAAARGRFTTGFWKILAGGLAALYAAHSLVATPGNPVWLWLVAAAVIALSANAFNLTDTRPVRTSALFLLFSAPLLVLTRGNGPLLAVCAATLAYLPFDRRRLVMLGDQGSNALGAVWAVSFVALTPAWAVVAALALLVLFHVWTEGHSLNAFLAAHPTLNAVDLWLRGPTSAAVPSSESRVRGDPPPSELETRHSEPS